MLKAPSLIAIALSVSTRLGFAADATVYRCPGAPIVYTDKISSEEASRRGCSALDGGSGVAAPPRPAPRQPTLPPQATPRPAEPSVKTGSAFMVSGTGLLVTNSHVVTGCQSVAVSQPGKQPREGSVWRRDSKNDLALVRFAASKTEAAAFRSTPIRPGDQVIVLGFPYRGLLSTEVNVSTGTVSALAGIQNDQSKLQIQAPVQPGNSGGPLLDLDGSIVGVVVARLNAVAVARATGDIPQNVNFAIKAEVVRSF